MLLKLPIMLLSRAMLQNQAYYAQNYAQKFKLCSNVMRAEYKKKQGDRKRT